MKYWDWCSETQGQFSWCCWQGGMHLHYRQSALSERVKSVRVGEYHTMNWFLCRWMKTILTYHSRRGEAGTSNLLLQIYHNTQLGRREGEEDSMKVAALVHYYTHKTTSSLATAVSVANWPINDQLWIIIPSGTHPLTHSVKTSWALIEQSPNSFLYVQLGYSVQPTANSNQLSTQLSYVYFLL